MVLATIAAVLFLPLGLAPANASPDYPPKFYKISAESYQVPAGRTVALTAQTFAAGSPVSVKVTADGAVSADPATVSADAKGVARASVTFTVVGVNTVTMAGTADDGKPLKLSTDITVTADDQTVTPAGDNGNGSSNAGGTDAAGGVPILGGLPRTGGQIAATALVAALLVGLGALLVATTRRRRTS